MHGEFNSDYRKRSDDRFKNTFRFLKEKVDKVEKILDLGPKNPFSEYLVHQGYQVTNTPTGQDLDLNFEIVKDHQYDVVTSFQIFEHMVSPFPLIQAIGAKKLLASIPLSLWFAKAYWNPRDPFDRHYHEFESRQFDMLLEKAGWKILDSEKWVNKTHKIGIRPILRRFTPRHYITYSERV